MSLDQSTSWNGYRDDIDGLRAIAVLAIVAYHAFPTLAPGGFIGVDIFFVISGYLISGIITSNLLSRRFSFVEFYLRRARRILPALAIVLVASWLLGWFFLLPDEYHDLCRHILGGLTFTSNFVALNDIGYFETAAELKPLIHLWSLAVEEQFYLIWPVALFIAWRLRLRFAETIAALALTSFALSLVYFGATAQAFYLPLPRIWELLIGGLLACSRSDSMTQAPSLANIVSICGLLFCTIAVFGLSRDHPYPYLLALIPTAGAFLTIAAGPGAWINARILSSIPMRQVGLISYPLYLWHWPILSFARIIEGEDLSFTISIGLIGASAVLAWMTYRFIERPLRKTPISLGLLAKLGSPLGISGLLALLTISGVVTGRLHAYGAISEARADWVDHGNVAIIGSSSATVLFFGDSFIEQYYPRLRHLSESLNGYHKSVNFHTAGGCSPLLLARKSVPGCTEFARAGFARAADPSVTTIVIGASWLGMLARGDFYREDDPTQSAVDFQNRSGTSALDEFKRNVERLVLSGKIVYVLLNPPVGPVADPGRLVRNRLWSTAALPYRAISLSEHRRQTRSTNSMIEELALSAGARPLDPADWMCGESECPTTTPTGIPFYKDSSHLRATYVRENIHIFDQLISLD
jgi:peptidoglycan/LPS O-acetylase OafA/YrhL